LDRRPRGVSRQHGLARRSARAGVILAEADGGGGDLALAMDVARSTAQYWHDVLRTLAAGVGGSWARGGQAA
jgi:hypothetical protein